MKTDHEVLNPILKQIDSMARGGNHRIPSILEIKYRTTNMSQELNRSKSNCDKLDPRDFRANQFIEKHLVVKKSHPTKLILCFNRFMGRGS